MSTLSDMTYALLSLFFPSECVGCRRVLEGRVEWICTHCRASMPSTYFHLSEDNLMAERLRGLSPFVVNAAAQFYYVNEGSWRNVIHEMKYRHLWHTAYKLGVWYGSELSESPLYQDIDVVIPVPLHSSRHIKRGYNQSELIARGISKELGVKLNTSALWRKRNNDSQVTHSKSQRWGNVQGIFAFRKRYAAKLAGKHILLVDDVFTTGATVCSCIETLVEAIPTCRISVVTLAVSRNEIMGHGL